MPMLERAPVSDPEEPSAIWKYAAVAAFIAILVWEAWWTVAAYRLNLFGCKYSWNPLPWFGADFFSQSDLAARLSARGGDPYASRGHLFHYPPLVIWSFRWTPFFRDVSALRIWLSVCVVLLVAGTFVALRVRRALGLHPWPASVAVALVLFSFPVLFQLERGNFDLITLGALLAAWPLFQRGTPKAEYVAGALLAAGPWVKLYPGIMFLGLLALRRYRAIAGFVLAGALIGLAAPVDTLHSFETLKIAMDRMKSIIDEPYAAWAHSLSVAWMKVLRLAIGTRLYRIADWSVANVLAASTILAIAVPICLRIYRSRGCEVLLYPLLLWLNALGSCFGIIANDYSLVFLPLAFVAVFSIRDSVFVHIAVALLAFSWQPIDIGVPGGVLLIGKMLGLVGIGASIVQRARELSSSRVEAELAAPVPSFTNTASHNAIP